MDTIEKFETRLVPTEKISIPAKWRKTRKRDIGPLAQSIASDGLLQPIGVRPDPEQPGWYILVYGRHRKLAHEKLGLDVIEARILDLDPEDAESAMHAENLFRTALDKNEHLDAIAAWSARYEVKHPDASKSGPRPKAAKVQPESDRTVADAEAKADAVVEPEAEPAKPFNQVYAEATGRGLTQSKQDIRIAKNLTGEQRTALIDKGTTAAEMYQIAGLKEPADRQKAVNLIASGMDRKVALAAATAPPGATVTEIVQVDAEGHKAEADMTDDEWVATYCGEALARLPHKAAYRTDAALWRAVRAPRHEFRSKTKRALSQSKAGVRGPFHYLVARLVNVSHPKDWPACGPCGGSGTAGDRSKCPKCYGNGYSLKTEM